jgi:alpha-soluble NSF attachment protein
MADPNAQRAADLIIQAEKKKNGFSWFSNSKFDDAADLYNKAANYYKMSRLWDQAANAFLSAGECYQKLGANHEVFNSYSNAASCFKKSNPQEAINCLIKSINFLTEEGRFSMAAKYHKEIAEMYEADGNLAEAINHYQTSADYYDSENSVSHANGCLLKVAHFAATLNDYEKAIKLFEEIAAKSLDNNLLKWSAKEYFFKAGLCRLCIGDHISSRRALDNFRETDPSFSGQREYKLLENLLNAQESSDLEKFENDVGDYESINKPDAWKAEIIGRIKSALKSQEDDFR